MSNRKRALAILAVAALLVALIPATVGAATTALFDKDDDGSYEFEVPSGVTQVVVTCFGAGGGGGGAVHEHHGTDHHSDGGKGGDGGKSKQTITVTPGETLYIKVGNGGAGGDGATYYDEAEDGNDGESSRVRRRVGGHWDWWTWVWDYETLVHASGGQGGEGGDGNTAGDPGDPGAGRDPSDTVCLGGAGGSSTGSQDDSVVDGKRGSDGWVLIELVTYELTVDTDGEGFGDVLVYADDTYIGSDGGYTLTYGTAIKVVADPEWCSYFDGWQGDYPEGEQDNPELEFELTGDVSLTALFELLTCDVEVGATEGGSVYIDYEGMFVPRGLVLDGEDDFEFLVGPGDSEDVTIYCCNSYFVLKAVPEDGWLFSHWELEGDVYPACEYTVQSEVFTAAYEESDPWTENPAAFVVDCGEGEGDCSGMITAVFVEEPGGEGSITVNVIKSDGGDVGGIAVSFGGDLSATVHTNSSGVAKVNGLWAGDYTANASAADYTSNGPKSVELEDDDSDESVTITLTPVPPAPPEPGPGAIEGKAEDGTTAAGLPGVLVRLLDSTDTIIGIKMTDAAGEFGFDGLEPGSYTVRGSLDGYGADTEVAVVVNDATTEVALQLAAVIVVPPTPPAGEPVVTPPDLPKTGATLTGLLIVSGLALGAGVFAKRRGF